MPSKPQNVAQDYQAQAEQAASQGDWKAATEFYTHSGEQPHQDDFVTVVVKRHQQA